MEIEYDAAKSEKNEAQRGLPFERALDFGFGDALVFEEIRRGEKRIRAIGMLDDQLHAIVFTRRKETMRVISLRRASRKERKLYAKAKAD